MFYLIKSLVFLLSFMAVTNTTFAQQMSVKSGKLVTFADHVSLVVEPKNTFNQKSKMQVRVYDHNFKLIKARVSPKEFNLPSGGIRNVRVVVPFLGATQKRFRICTERIPTTQTRQQVRTRVCGRFYATRVKQ